MTERVLTARELNRALLARQLLLERARLSVPRAIERVARLQTPPPGHARAYPLAPHWDANLLVHARRAQILPEEYRDRVFSTKNPFSVGTVLVDGRVAGAWNIHKGRITVEPYEPLTRSVHKGSTRRPSA